MAKPKHHHKYIRVTLGKNYIVFKCSLPDCPHYIRYELAEGKICICNRCNKQMLLTRESMKLKKPHCTDCVQRKKGDTINAVRSVLADILGSDDIPENTRLSSLREKIRDTH